MAQFRKLPAEELNRWRDDFDEEEEWEEEDEEVEVALPPGFPNLDSGMVEEWLGSGSLAKGRPYARQGSIFNAARVGTALKAQCQGSLPQPYRVQATLGPRGVVSADCSCPVGDGGRCKHVAAMLLAWLADPAGFEEREPVETALAQRDKAELIALIRRMVDRYPELEEWLALPSPSKGQGKLLDPDVVRRQVRGAIRNAGDEWGASYALASDLERIAKLGDDYAAAGAWRNATTVYATVAREVLDQYDTYSEEEGEIGLVVSQCVSGLGQCLDATGDEVQREAILRALFDIYLWDLEWGGIGMGEESPDIIAAQVTPDERQRVVGWAEAAMGGGSEMDGGSDWSASFRRQTLGGFLIQLQADTLDDETFLQLARASERVGDVVARLLERGRVDEAEAEARQAPGLHLLQMADLLRHYGEAERAERMVRAVVADDPNGHFVMWLRQRAAERGDTAETLRLTETLFWQHPSLAGYREVRTLAQQLGRWEGLRAILMARLRQQNLYALVTEIHLDEGEVAEALETLPQAGQGWGWHTGQAPLSIRVARAAEGSYPREAIALYMAKAQSLIDARGRENYTVAADYLLRVRGIMRQLGEAKQWDELIHSLRERHRSLRALKEELSKLGL